MNRIRLFLCAALAALAWNPAFAANDSGLPGEFLNFGTGARSQAMGRAYTGVADDIDALFWNPAGLATYRSSQVGFQYTPLPLGGAFQDLAYSQPLKSRGALGFGILNLTSGDVPRVDANNIEAGSFNSRETAYMAAYAHRLFNALALGGTVKMAEKVVDGHGARGFGADVGGMYLYKDRARIGMTLRNLIPPAYSYDTDKEVFPVIWRAGGSVNFLEHHLLAAMDLEKTVGSAQDLRWHFGVEGSLTGFVLLRAGLDENEYMTGIGIRWKSLQIDYAAGFQDLGLVNRTSLKVVFGGYEVDVKAAPRVFSPLGLRKTTTFKIASGNRERVVNWVLSIRNGNNEVVKSFTGYSAPPKTLEWDGKDAQGQVAPEGEYVYRLSVTDNKNAIETTAPRTLRIVSPTPFEIEAK